MLLLFYFESSNAHSADARVPPRSFEDGVGSLIAKGIQIEKVLSEGCRVGEGHETIRVAALKFIVTIGQGLGLYTMSRVSAPRTYAGILGRIPMLRQELLDEFCLRQQSSSLNSLVTLPA